MFRGECRVDFGGGILLVLMGAGCEPQRTPADFSLQSLQLRLVDRQPVPCRLQIADGDHVFGAQPAEAASLLSILRQTQRKRTEHRPDQPGPSLPTPE